MATELDEQIERLRKGDTLAENEVKALCDKVSDALCCLEVRHRQCLHNDHLGKYTAGSQYGAKFECIVFCSVRQVAVSVIISLPGYGLELVARTPHA